MPKVVIVGAGLAGSLLAIYLARRDISVEIYEARPDMRTAKIGGGRSINLALSDRGIAALREVGMDGYMLAEAVAMHGRMIHSPTGETKLLPYSGRKGEFINSVSRGGLNTALMNAAEKYPNVKFHFERRCTGLDVKTGRVYFENGLTALGETVVATDGAGSAVRRSLESEINGFQLSEVFLEHGYKELHIPPADGGTFQLEKNALHIWPRHQFMMIALPNFDGSFTCTLFLAKHGRATSGGSGTDLPGFDQLDNERNVHSFFNQEFPDAVPLMPTLIEDFFNNPTGQLGTVKCWPWNIDGNALLLGDSAHAMVPFYGQGMNCAFEDARVLDELMGKHGSTLPASTGSQLVWEQIFEEYSSLRKQNTDAIQDMAEENFYEMRDATADPVFQRKRALETKLEQTYADYFSKYSMVTFREDLPYKIAKQRGNSQDEVLMKISADVDSIDELDLDEVIDEVRGLER